MQLNNMLKVHDKAVNPRLATFHLLITEPVASQSSAAAAPPAATPPAATPPAATTPAAPVVVGLIRCFKLIVSVFFETID